MKPSGPVERSRRLLSRAGAILIGVLLAGGLGAALAGATSVSQPVLAAAVSLLIAVPVMNVCAVLAEEVRRKDWPFVAAAALVLALVAYAVVDKLG